VPSSSEELSPELIGVSAWDLHHNRGLAPLSNHFKAALGVLQAATAFGKTTVAAAMLAWPGRVADWQRNKPHLDL